MSLSIGCQCLPVPLELLIPWEGPRPSSFPIPKAGNGLRLVQGC